MAIQIVPILKTLAPLVTNASGIVANLKAAKHAPADAEERIRRLEEEAIAVGELLSATTKQLEAVAQQMRVQAELDEAYERRTKGAYTMAVIALCLSIAAVALALIF